MNRPALSIGWVVLGVLTLATVGCGAPTPIDQDSLRRFNRDRRVVYYVEGTGGWTTSPYESVRDGLHDAGVVHEVRNFDWHFGLPYVFVFNPALLMQASVLKIVTVIVVLVTAVVFYAGALSGFLFRPLYMAERGGVFAVAVALTVLCAFPDAVNSLAVRLIAVALFLWLVVKPFLLRMRRRAHAPA